MKITKKGQVIVDLSEEAKAFIEENDVDPYFKDYRRDDKLKLQPEMEAKVEIAIVSRFPKATGFKYHILDTENLTVRVKFVYGV